MNRFLTSAAFCVLLVASCSRKDDEPAPAPPPQPRVIIDESVDETGGLFEVPLGEEFGGLRIWVPPGALGGSAGLTVTWTPLPDSTETGYRFITAAWAVGFGGAPLSKPYNLRMPCLSGETTAEGGAVLRWDPALAFWEPAMLARLDASPDAVVTSADTPGTHAHHLVNTVIPFLRDQCPELDGIMLDYIRYEVGSWTEADRDLISRIVARIREALGRKGQSRRHRLYACLWCFTAGNEDGRMAVGQRYSDFALDCDVLLPMMYGGNDPYPAADLEWYALRTALYRTQRNLTGTMAGIMTYGNATPTTINDQLTAVLKQHMNGFAMYRYAYTSAAEWDVIDDFCSP